MSRKSKPGNERVATNLLVNIEISTLLGIPLLHFNAAFVRMKERHLHLKEKYPDKPQAKGSALTGISNARPETKIWKSSTTSIRDFR